MNKNTHSIEKVFLELETPSVAMAHSIKNNLAVFLQNELIPILEKQFNQLQKTGNQIIQIEKLTFSITSFSDTNHNFPANNEAKNDIKNQIEKEISKALYELKKPLNGDKNISGLRTLSSPEKELKTLLYFIENGSMPWWIAKEDTIVFFEKINLENIQKEAFRIPFSQLLQQKKVQKRILNQFTNAEIVVFTAALLNSEAEIKPLSKNSLLQFIIGKPQELKASFWQSLFDKNPKDIVRFYHQNRIDLVAEKISFDLFIQNIRTFFPLSANDAELDKLHRHYLDAENVKAALKTDPLIKKPKSNLFEIESKKEENFQEETTNSKSCYVQNAGLLLLHPFLEEILKNCDLTDDKNNILNKELAAHILHYAATKKQNDYEHTMLFEKFLCGIPLQQSIQREIKIEDKHKEQIEEMLLSVVAHWSALKSTSTDILRSEFLQREGKLDWSESNPRLTIERKTQDLLLEKIPWNINIIKIPWMEKLIYTQW